MGLLAAIGLHAHPGPLFAVQKADHLPDGGRKQRRNAAVELEARWGRLIWRLEARCKGQWLADNTRQLISLWPSNFTCACCKKIGLRY